VVVAAHLGADRIKRGTFKLIAFLYGFFSLVAFVRFSASGYQVLRYQNELLARNCEPWSAPSLVGMFFGLGTLVLIGAGTVGTLWFLASCFQSPSDGKA